MSTLETLGVKPLINCKGTYTVSGGSLMLPEDLSNHSPRLKISWDPVAVGVTGHDIANTLLGGNPRIILNGVANDSIIIMPYMMNEGEERIAAEAITQAFSTIPRRVLAPRLSP